MKRVLTDGRRGHIRPLQRRHSRNGRKSRSRLSYRSRRVARLTRPRRIYQQAIKENNLLSQPITIINVGGHFSIGSRQVMEADADGYNFLLVHIALMGGEGSGAPWIFGWRDFEPVAATGEFCVLPMVRKDSGINTIQELIEKAKAEPDSLIFGANLGAINHMAGIMMEQANQGNQVPLRADRRRHGQLHGADRCPDEHDGSFRCRGRQVHPACRTVRRTRNPRSRRWPIPVPQRLPAVPDLPTMKEAGYDMEFCIKSWWFAPKGTPKEAIDGFAAALGKSMDTDVVKKFNSDRYFTPVFLSGRRSDGRSQCDLEGDRTGRQARQEEVITMKRRPARAHISRQPAIPSKILRN